jgi:hypothetical protein
MWHPFAVDDDSNATAISSRPLGLKRDRDRIKKLDEAAMKSFIGIFLLLIFTGCAAQLDTLVWRVKDVVLSPIAEVRLAGPDGELVLTVPTRTIQEMYLAHTRISRTANVQSELYIAAGDEPNAFAGPDATGRNIMALNVGMIG